MPSSFAEFRAKSRGSNRPSFASFRQQQAQAEDPEFSWFDTAISTGLRVVPSILGTVGGGAAGLAAGGVGAAPGAIAGGAGGGALGEWLAQLYEQRRGAREELNPTSIAIEAGLGAIPLGKSATLARAAAKGAGMGVAGTALHGYAEEGELPSAGRLGLSALLGGGFGAGGEAIGRRLTRARPETPPTAEAPPPWTDEVDFYEKAREFDRELERQTWKFEPPEVRSAYDRDAAGAETIDFSGSPGAMVRPTPSFAEYLARDRALRSQLADEDAARAAFEARATPQAGFEAPIPERLLPPPPARENWEAVPSVHATDAEAALQELIPRSTLYGPEDFRTVASRVRRTPTPLERMLGIEPDEPIVPPSATGRGGPPDGGQPPDAEALGLTPVELDALGNTLSRSEIEAMAPEARVSFGTKLVPEELDYRAGEAAIGAERQAAEASRALMETLKPSARLERIQGELADLYPTVGRPTPPPDWRERADRLIDEELEVAALVPGAELSPLAKARQTFGRRLTEKSATIEESRARFRAENPNWKPWAERTAEERAAERQTNLQDMLAGAKTAEEREEIQRYAQQLDELANEMGLADASDLYLSVRGGRTSVDDVADTVFERLPEDTKAEIAQKQTARLTEAFNAPEPAGAARERDVSELERLLTPADTLDTGELQPRLPGDVGDVREQNIPTPEFEAPFALTSKVSQEPEVTTADLFAPSREPVVEDPTVTRALQFLHKQEYSAHTSNRAAFQWAAEQATDPTERARMLDYVRGLDEAIADDIAQARARGGDAAIAELEEYAASQRAKAERLRQNPPQSRITPPEKTNPVKLAETADEFPFGANNPEDPDALYALMKPPKPAGARALRAAMQSVKEEAAPFNPTRILKDVEELGGIKFTDADLSGELRDLAEWRERAAGGARGKTRWKGGQIAGRAILRKKGLSPEYMAEALRERGYDIVDGGQLVEALKDAVRAAEGGFGSQRGEIANELSAMLAGGAGGALVGGTQGDTTEERLGYALAGGAAGAAGAGALARLFRVRGTAAAIPEGPQHVTREQGIAETAPGLNREAPAVPKTIETPTGRLREQQGDVPVLRFMGGEIPSPVKQPRAQREDLGLDAFPEEQREGMASLIAEFGGGDVEKGLDVLERQRRWRQPMARTQALADHIAVSLKAQMRPGTNLPAAGHAAYGNALATVQDELRDLGQRIKQTGGSDADLLRLGELNAAQRVLFLNVAGLRSEAGRALQIYNAMKRVMPHEIQLVREMLDRGRLRKDLIDLSDVMANLDSDPVRAFEQLRAAERRTLGERVADYYMSNILSGIKTQERNAMGNASRLASRLVTKVGTGGLEALSSLVTGKPRSVYATEVLHEVQGGLAGFSKAVADFTETFRLGFSPTALREGLDVDGPVYLPKVEMPGGLKNPLNYPGRLLEATDRLFRQLNGSMELYGLTYAKARAQAEREQLTGSAFTNRVSDLMTGMRLNPDKELKRAIAKTAERAVFQERDSPAVQTLIGLKRQVPALNYVIPFVNTVHNIMKQGVEHTPLGFLMKRARQTDDLREQTIARGEAAMGTLALMPIAYYAATGQISGSGPKDPGERARLYESGWRPNSIRIGDRWVSYTLLQPFSIPISIVANGFEAWQETSRDATEKTRAQNVESVVAQTIARVGKSALDQSFLSGLGDLVKAINDPERASAGFFARVASGFVPLSGLQRNVAQFVDPTVRQPTGVLETLASGIPGASMTVNPRLNRWGEEATRERHTALLVPEATAVENDPVADELTRLGLDVGLPTDRVNFNELAPGARQLTSGESFELRQTRGRATRVILGSIMQMPGYDGLPDVLKAELLRRALRDGMGDVNDVARVALQGGRPDLLKQLSDPLEELAAATYAR